MVHALIRLIDFFYERIHQTPLARDLEGKFLDYEQTAKRRPPPRLIGVVHLVQRDFDGAVPPRRAEVLVYPEITFEGVWPDYPPIPFP